MDTTIIEQHIGDVLEKTDFRNLGIRRQGKVRDVYEQGDKLILVATDRYSAFDRNLALVPFKGHVLTQSSTFWFSETKDIIENHLIANPDPNVVVVKKCSVIPVEVVVRAYMSGVTGTSTWTLYQKGEREFGGVTLPEGMKKNQKLERPIITPTSKNDMHDEPLTSADVVGKGLVEAELWNKIRDVALKLFARGTEVAREHGLILVDTKYEFGVAADGSLLLIDEIHTPDSSRYWQVASYEERIAAGEEPENFDKEFLRLWFKANSDPYNDETLPEAPREMVVELSSRYIQIFEQLTGKKFEPDFTLPIADRIRKNLEQYHV